MNQYFPVVFPVFFVGIWLLVGTVLSRVGGWHLLAESFQSQLPFEGEQWRFQTGQMRWGTNYNGCLTIGANSAGLYLAVMFLFRIGHPALFIPWSEIRVSRKKAWYGEVVTFTLGREADIPLRIRAILADKIRSAAAGSWPPEDM